MITNIRKIINIIIIVHTISQTIFNQSFKCHLKE